MPILKVVAVGVPHTATVVEVASVAASVIPAHPVMANEAVPATKVSGAPTVRVPAAAVKTPVTVLIAVTATGADWEVTWKVPAAGLIAYSDAVAKAALEEGHAGTPPPVGDVNAPVPTVMTTR